MTQTGETEVGAERATLADVAERAGVSLAAASLALRGKPGVGESTRRRIVDIARELEYRTRGAGDHARSFGILVKVGPHDLGETNAFYGPVIAGITDACATADLDVRIDTMRVDEHFNPIETPRLVESGKVDGFLVLGAYLSEASAQVLASRPVVLVDGYAADPGGFASVVSDNIGGTAAATSRLVELGHHRIALVGTTIDAFPSIRDRRLGYERTMSEARLAPMFVDGHHDLPAECVRAATAALQGADAPTAFVAANDDVALALIGELRDQIPGRVSVVGFDDIAAASLVRPRLDTVAIDKRAMGRIAVSMLRHRIVHAADPPFTVTQRASLIVRETTAAPVGEW
jgi:LacI family transcriptional regulator